MSLPNYLAKIKSSGTYRFVFDDSTISPQEAAETLRLVCGYSEKGPFNTPVLVETPNDFITIFGNISKRLERRGVYFHRMALQALQAGPILALNLKPFNDSKEKVDILKLNISDIDSATTLTPTETDVKKIYNTNRFWYLDEDKLIDTTSDAKYVQIAATDTKDKSCTIFIRKYTPDGYGLTIRDWFSNNTTEEMPEYLGKIQDKNLNAYFAEVFVFRGEFTKEVASSDALKDYFTVSEDKVTLKASYTNPYSGNTDVLIDLANDPNSNFVGRYQGTTIPYFKDANGRYISLDIVFNKDNYIHNMMMKFNEGVLESADDVNKYIGFDATPATVYNYIEGYTYTSIESSKKGAELVTAILTMLDDKGIRTALTNNVDVNYHYLIDTFRTYTNTTDKTKLFSIAKAKDNCFAIVNFPFMTDMITSGKIDTSLYSMPKEIDGASWGAYFTSLIFSDGAIKETVPSAACVSNNFMDKYGSRLPYDIVAGPKYGRIVMSGLVGPDYKYGRDDLDILEPYGVNAIIYVPRKGTYINSNQTAKQVPVSGLSKIHIRELVTYVQDEIQSLLESYQWDKNTSALRDTIKAKADAILENVKNNDGVYAYNNTCDDTNNTAEVIDNEMIILDTEIEPARGAGKMVNRLTIRRTGGISSTIV